MKDFSNPSFAPEVISVMDVALDAAVASLPEPVARVNPCRRARGERNRERSVR
jgi:hypothetical protein